MTDYSDKALLPTGMGDGLPPGAAFESETKQRLLASFAAYGYDRVKPPLLEFEESLLSGNGCGLAAQTFRLMDPASRKMMGLRPDMTLQVARIATTRLTKSQRPLRLAYAGEVLRVMGSQLRPERQFTQVGAELIGSSAPTADAEVVLMAVDALQALGIKRLSVDLGLPCLVPALCRELTIEEGLQEELCAALDGKDAAEVARLCKGLGDKATTIFKGLLQSIGTANESLATLQKLDLPGAAADKLAELASVVGHIQAGAPDLALTIDPIDDRGFEYHAGVTFTLFSLGVRGELGSGGRYIASRPDSDEGEPATGLTLFMDTVLRAMPEAPKSDKLYIPFGIDAVTARKLRAEGWITLQGLETEQDAPREAKRLGCSHILGASGPETIS